MKSSDNYWEWMWQHWDAAFSDRPDYRLWRCTLGAGYKTDLAREWLECLSSTLRSGIACVEKACELQPDTSHTVQAWGVLSVSAVALSDFRSSEFYSRVEERELSQKVKTLRGLIEELPFLGHFHAECGCTRIVASAAFQHYLYEAGQLDPIEPQGALDYLALLESWINREVDPNWNPGEVLDFYRALASQPGTQDNQPQLIPRRDKSYVASDLTLALYRIQFRARGSLNGVEPSSFGRSAVRKLLRILPAWARSAWRRANFDRYAQERYVERLVSGSSSASSVKKARERLRHLKRFEMLSLMRVGSALYEAGKYLDAAQYAAYLLHVLPPDLEDDESFRNLPDTLSGPVRQVGLEIPPDFEDTEVRQELGEQIGGTWRSVVDSYSWLAPMLAVLRSILVRTNDSVTAVPIGRRREIYEQEFHPELRPLWKWVLRRCPVSVTDRPKDALLWMVDLIEQGSIRESKEEKQAAFVLCVAYGQLERAATLLRSGARFYTSTDIARFANEVRRAQLMLPRCLDRARHESWRFTIRKAADRVAERIYRPDDALAIHEALLGRMSVLLRQTPAGTWLLRKQYSDRFDKDRDSRSTLSRKLLSGWPVEHQEQPLGLTTERVSKFVKECQDSPLGSPLCMSVVRLSEGDEEEWSFLSSYSETGSDVDWAHQVKRMTGPQPGITFSTAIENIKQTRKTWAQDSISGFSPGSSLKPLMRQIRDSADSVGAVDAQWILLAVEPDIAGLPWHRLLANMPDGPIICSIVPSFGWALLASNARNEQEIFREGWELDGPTAEPELQPLKRRLEAVLPNGGIGSPLASGLMVLGHGDEGIGPEGDPFRTVRVGRETYDVDSWLAAATLRRVVAIHSCRAGGGPSLGLGDFGMLASALLGTGPRLVCAPVCEIPADPDRSPAPLVQRALSGEFGGSTVGECYREALVRDHSNAVDCYQLYGLASEEIPNTA